MSDDWEKNRRRSVAQNIAGIIKVYGRTPRERMEIYLEFFRGAAMQLVGSTELGGPEYADDREAVISAVERILDQLLEDDNAAGSSARGRLWRDQGRGLQGLVQSDMDRAEVRYGGDPDDRADVCKAYAEEAGRRLWKLNAHLTQDSARLIVASQLARLAEAYAEPPKIGRDRES